jgi:hypothetical protein
VPGPRQQQRGEEPRGTASGDSDPQRAPSPFDRFGSG